MMLTLELLAPAAYVTYTTWKLKKYLHVLQLNSYMNDRYYQWLRKNFAKNVQLRDFIPMLSLILCIADASAAAIVVWTGSYVGLFVAKVEPVEKKKFVFTSRAKRLFAVTLLLLLMISVVAFYTAYHVGNFYTAVILAVLTILNVLAFGITLLGNFLVAPLEKSINRWYYRDAKKIVQQMPNLKIIGITGSFGKTSTKYILSKILAEKFNVLMTPESYNTAMGVTKVIRTDLKPIHEIFVVEMGAKQPGDIKELCELVSPRLGILTAIGEQHLDTFKNIEGVKLTKHELVESLPDQGIAFLNGDNEHILSLPKTTVRKVYYGITGAHLDYTAANIQITPKGSTFTVYQPSGDVLTLQTPLLGKYNIYNILAAVAVACELGIDVKTIRYAVRNLESVPHRLQLKHTAQGITIIDDAFNSNPIGSRLALDVLQNMTGQQKILVTPGMVELGSREYELNKELAIYAAKVCDYIILVGRKQTLPLQDGLKSVGYSDKHYYVAADLNDANRHLQTLTRAGDVVLFENDLPDTYNES